MRLRRVLSAAVAAAAVTVGGAHAATISSGYVDGDLGPLLNNDPDSGGSSDRITDTGITNQVYEYTGLWSVGDQVTITGIAVPLHKSHASGVLIVGQTLDYSFYQLGGGANADGFDGDTDDPLIDSEQGTIGDIAGANVSSYSIIFDNPVTFVANSTGIAIGINNLGPDGFLRFKDAAGSGVVKNLSTGAVESGSQRMDIAGIAVPEPSSLLLVGLVALMSGVVAMRRRLG